QALYVAFLHEGLPEAPERDARIDGTCPVALAYRGGMGAIIKSLAQIPASDSLRRRVVRLALYKAHVDLLAPAPILDVMVHATLLNDMASAGILPRWSVAAARAAYEKAEAQRIAVNEAARGAQAPLTEELRAAEVARSSLMAFVSQLDGAAPQRDASATGPGFP
ncbi:MAG TPA: hypothetical protein VFH51_10990, partial [Myxococcota bacterium]|nr:hypothetical protein [Myxococcota bacterium]